MIDIPTVKEIRAMMEGNAEKSAGIQIRNITKEYGAAPFSALHRIPYIITSLSGVPKRASSFFHTERGVLGMLFIRPQTNGVHHTRLSLEGKAGLHIPSFHHRCPSPGLQ